MASRPKQVPQPLTAYRIADGMTMIVEISAASSSYPTYPTVLGDGFIFLVKALLTSKARLDRPAYCLAIPDVKLGIKFFKIDFCFLPQPKMRLRSCAQNDVCKRIFTVKSAKTRAHYREFKFLLQVRCPALRDHRCVYLMTELILTFTLAQCGLHGAYYGSDARWPFKQCYVG